MDPLSTKNVDTKTSGSKRPAPSAKACRPYFQSERILPASPSATRMADRTPSKVNNEEAFDDMDIIEGDYGEAPGSDDATTGDHIDTDGAKGSSSRPELESALRISKSPIREVAQAWKLARFLQNNLERDGIEYFFPIQALTIPDVIASERHPYIQARDVCITAPTGSGKTLSYVLPILNALASRSVRRLRALVILPSRDLADQVFKVFHSFTQGSNLKVGLAVGRSDFKTEQIALTVNPRSSTTASLCQRLLLDPGNLELVIKASRFPSNDCSNLDGPIPQSAVDVLVCTPGRLIDHLDSTPGFTLQHLRFICIDEADRLLNQSYHNWFSRVMDAARPNKMQISQLNPMKILPDGSGFDIRPTTWRRQDLENMASAQLDMVPVVNPNFCQPVQLRKFLISATLTGDPQKLASLQLVNPKRFDLHQVMLSTESGQYESKKYSMPPGLEEYTVECTAEQKPIVLISILLDKLRKTDGMGIARNKCIIVVFTSSLDSTHRLSRLLQLLWLASGLGDATAIAEFSSSLSQKERTSLIQRCKSQEDQLVVVVCSDGMSRGMDIEHVSTVINYDVPRFAKVYLHRCGRTARAGKSGTSITLLKGGQIAQFRHLRGLIQSPESLRTTGVKKHFVRDILPHYRSCVEALRSVLKAESDGEIMPYDTLALREFLDPVPRAASLK